MTRATSDTHPTGAYSHSTGAYSHSTDAYSHALSERAQSMRRLEVAARGSCAVLVVMIAYGSLYPFRFAPPPREALTAFASTLGMPHPTADILGNVALFLPLGLAIAFATPRAWLALLGGLLAGGSLALGMQLLQLALPVRDAALDDVVFNLIGLGTGLAVGWLLRRALAGRPPLPRTGMIGLLAVWLLSHLVPLVPNFSPASMLGALESLRAPPQSLYALPTLAVATGTYMGSVLFAALLGRRSAAAWLPLELVAVVFGRVVVELRAVDWPLLLGLTGGYALWHVRPKVAPWLNDTALAAALAALVYVLQALEPFDLTRYGRPFNWWPLADLLEGGMLGNVLTLLPRLFLLGSVCWFGMQIVPRPLLASAAAVLVCLGLEALQCNLPGRTPSITDPVLLAGCALLSWAMLPPSLHARHRAQAAPG